MELTSGAGPPRPAGACQVRTSNRPDLTNADAARNRTEIGRASCRERGGWFREGGGGARIEEGKGKETGGGGRRATGAPATIGSTPIRLRMELTSGAGPPRQAGACQVRTSNRPDLTNADAAGNRTDSSLTINT